MIHSGLSFFSVLTSTHTCTVYPNTYNTCMLSRGNELGWQLFCDSVRQNWPSINSRQLHLLSPLQRDHHSRTCRTGSCHEMWRSLAAGHTQSENEILWSLYVTVHYAKCETLSCICRNVLFPESCHSAHQKIKEPLFTFTCSYFPCRKKAQQHTNKFYKICHSVCHRAWITVDSSLFFFTSDHTQ